MKASAVARPSPLAASRALAAFLAVLVLTATLHAEENAAWELVDEHWYVIEINAQPGGWVRTSVHDDGERYRTRTKMHMAVERAEVPVSITTTETFIESHSGRPVAIHLNQIISHQAVESEWIFDNGTVRQTTRQGGRETTREVPAPEGAWLTPRAAHRFFLERARAGAEEITWRRIESQAGITPVTLTRVRTGEATFTFEERELPATVWTATESHTPGMEATEHISADGYLLRQEIGAGGMRMSVRLARRDEVRALADAPAPELLIGTFIVPAKPIDNVRQTRRAIYRVRVRDGSMPELPQAGAQRVRTADDGRSAVLRMKVDDPLPAAADEIDDERYRQASPMIESDDALIQALARRVVRNMPEEQRTDPRSRAEAMRGFVYEYITDKSMDTVFASASETARLRGGDCSEHSVLLAAVLRADGIPARIASGLVYIDDFAGQDGDGRGIFGWHMWTQALIDRRWIDLDATLPVRFHAGYVLTGTSSLADGMAGADVAAMMQLMGNLEIEVVRVER